MNDQKCIIYHMLCIAGMTHDNIYVFAQAALFQLCQRGLYLLALPVWSTGQS